MSDDRDIVAVFNCLLLARSETFVRAQGEALRKHRAVYVGSRRVRDGLELPEERTLCVNTGGVLGNIAEAAFKYTGRAPLLERKLAALRPALVHAHFGLGGALVLPAARRMKLPLVVTFHGADATVHDEAARRMSHTHRIYLRRRAQLLREAALIIAVSRFMRERVIALGAAPEKVVVHYIGIDTEVFAPDERVAREPVVLFVGRLVEKKGCDDLIRAMRDVRIGVPEAKLRIVGDGEERARLQRLAGELLPRDAYEFVGMQTQEQVRQHIRRASIFCSPSITAASGDAEGFGLVFTEAQAMGTPVVSTRSGGIAEAVDHGRTGLLVGERRPEELGRAIVQLLRDQGMWRAFSETGARWVREKFDLMKQTAELEELYLRAVGAHKETTLTLPSPGLPGEGNEGNSEESLAGVVH